MRNSVRIRDFEAAFLQIVAEIQQRTADEKRTFGIDDHADILRLNKDVAISGTIDKVHFVLQAGAPAADHGHAQRAVRPALFLEQREQFARGIFGHLDQAFIADLVIDAAFGR